MTDEELTECIRKILDDKTITLDDITNEELEYIQEFINDLIKNRTLH